MSDFDEEVMTLKKTFDSIVLEWPYVDIRCMNGHPAYQVDGELFAILSTKGIALAQLPPNPRAPLANEFDVSPFETDEGTSKEWACVEIDDVRDLDRLLPFIQRSYRIVLDDS